MVRKVLVSTALMLLASAASGWSQDAAPTPAPKCSAIAPKNFPPAPVAAATKPGRFAGCLAAKECNPTSEKAIATLGLGFCARNNYAECKPGTCDKPTLACMPEFRGKESKGLKLSNCVSRMSKIACPKDGEEICLCDIEIEAKGSIQCGCSCQIAPTPTPVAR